MYDLVVIGGGLSGMALAIDMKKRGYSVAVIEKGIYPRHKVCGEYISNESKQYLHHLCPVLKTQDLPEITKFTISTLGNKSFSMPLALGGFGISRYLLENIMHEEGLKLGVVFFLKSKAYELTHHFNTHSYSLQVNGNKIETKLVCNATGRHTNSGVQNIGQSNNYVGVKYHIKTKRDNALIEIHNFDGGYCGVSNVEEGISCLCYMINSGKLKTAGNSISLMEQKTLFKNTSIKNIFETSEFLFKEPLTISGIHFKSKTTSSPSSFFLGDSAGTIAPITGNGMSMGLRSACILSEEMNNYLSGKIAKNQLVLNYEIYWTKHFGKRIKLSRYFQKLSEYPFLTKNTIKLFKYFPGLAGKMVGLTHGQPF
ncbi:MAG: hypothetical protein JWO32_2583 [Bacteroidetes bacterium]|nr:hypothetical protein [Bacteroidota bacterium]